MEMKTFKPGEAYWKINAWMDKRFERITPQDFYRLLFPVGALETQQERDEKAKGRYGAITMQIWKDAKGKPAKVQRRTLTDDLKALDAIVKSDAFCIMPPISYAGQAAKKQNARNLYAIAIDVDNIACEKGKPAGLRQFFYQVESDRCPPSHRIPQPTAIVSSGSGIHVYWMLKDPVHLFPHFVPQVLAMRKRLTALIWKNGTSSTHHDEEIQYEGVYQGLRMVGSMTKGGERVVAWRTGDPVTLDYLNGFMPEDCRIDNPETAQKYKSKYTLAYCAEHFKDWYQRRIIEKQPPKKWHCNRAVYDWWLRRAQEAEVGHRYYTMMCAAIYGIKCDIPREEVYKDVVKLGKELDKISPTDGSNNITALDVIDALKAYVPTYYTYPINEIVYYTRIQIEKNKRNGRPRSVHVKIMNSTRDILHPNGEWRNKDGRPSKQDEVQAWRVAHPDGTKAACIRDTGLSKPTVYRWWEG